MKFLAGFVRSTLLGGVFFLMPVAMLAILLGKAMSVASKFAKPIAEALPDEWNLGVAKVTLLEIVMLVLVCFVAGLLARMAVAQRLVRGLESSVLSKVPAYAYFKQLTGGLLGADDLSRHPVVLARMEGGWQIAVQVESEVNGFVTVFIPDAPNPRSGSVYMLPADQVLPAGAERGQALNCLKRFGVGTSDLLRNKPSGNLAKS
jgi:uncharacterized membrane protein